ncbi:MAG: bifunctional folylpolyglutamate synthase/dihydrofolate synthase [Peptostreptococcaceae bacterium]|nr:bifunctional folylpolyglutamate synthase/dihydrofolate synthase [Peptostreptococcaceae bacterium]
MKYKEALEYIHGTYRFGIKLGLNNIRMLLEKLGNPQDGLRIIHVAGTNGKGSTRAFINSVLSEAGNNVGLYTSPYLEVFNERIQINGNPIEDERLADLTQRVKEKVDILVSEGNMHPTEFEIVTAIAFCYFKEENVDILILEVGMGGRLDATNVIKNSLVSVIAPLALDHTQYLGETIGEIAREKGGIIKENGFVISATQPIEAEKVIQEICKEKHARLETVKTYNYQIVRRSLKTYEFKSMILNISGNLKIELLGEHQIRNCILAVRVLEFLVSKHGIELDSEVILRGLEKTRWPGRLEVIAENPCLIIDGAHNKHGAIVLSNFMEYHFNPKKRRGFKTIGVIGVLGDKDVSGIVEETVHYFDSIIATEPENKRAMKVEDLKALIEMSHDSVEGIKNWKDAVEKALTDANPEDCIVVYGSLYLIGYVRSFIANR